MAEVVRRRWSPQGHGLTRRDRRGCQYEAYVPDPLIGWEFALPADLAADIADAELAIRELRTPGTGALSFEGLARFLLRAESVASSRIEGLDAGARRLIEAEAIAAHGGEPRDRIAVEVLGNIAAMESAIAVVGPGSRVELGDLLGIHRVLMARSPTPQLGGQIRTEQNWIGGSSHNPCGASFIPPPPERVGELLSDLVAYINSDEHPALVEAALAHAQFETIHPFADGNGRTGRALIHTVLRRRGVAQTTVPPVSLVLATWADQYIAGLTQFRHRAGADSPDRAKAAVAWLRVFVAATLRACTDARAYAHAIDAMVDRWHDQLGPIRKGSSVEHLLASLPGVPLVTVESAARLVGRSDVAAGAALNRMVAAGILEQRNVGRQRYRIFVAPDVISLFTALERQLASPAGNTALSSPVRPAPSKPFRQGSVTMGPYAIDVSDSGEALEMAEGTEHR